MDGIQSRRRIRVVSFMEWLLAAAVLLAVLGAGVLVDRHVRPALPAPLRPEMFLPVAASVPASVPLRAVSLPLLPFGDGKEVRVGESVSAVAAVLGRAAEIGTQVIDRGPAGERLTRFYEYAGRRFILVFDRLDRHADARLAAIYLP